MPISNETDDTIRKWMTAAESTNNFALVAELCAEVLRLRAEVKRNRIAITALTRPGWTDYNQASTNKDSTSC